MVLTQLITCHYCFEAFDADLEVDNNFCGKVEEIYDCKICCNPNRILYEVNDGGITSLTVDDGNS